METSEKTIDVLNDLVKINNDRVAGFEKAGEDLEDNDNGLQAVFSKLADESRSYSAELSGLARQYGATDDDVADGTSVSGSLHRAWIDVKSTFTGTDTESILNECERGEDAIKSAYKSALEDRAELPYQIVDALTRQQQGIIEGHNLIKSLRDQSKATDNAEENNSTENDGTVYTGSVDNDEWKNKEEDYKPFASNETSEIENNQQDDLDENELALANEVPAPPVNDGVYNNAEETNGGPVDVGEYQNDGTVESEEGAIVSEDSRLQEFFVNELKDLLWAEQKLVDTLPKMADAATSTELRQAFQSHLAQTEEHVQRLEQIFGTLGLEPDTTKCDAMDGIVDEGDEIIDNTDEGTATRDVGLIFAGQKVEHYEIASYGGMVSLAKTLGYTEAAGLLSMTLDEEKAADELLTEIAENNVNYEASGEQKEKGFFS
jgi:uncharacterized protein (TIGR02284 family)